MRNAPLLNIVDTLQLQPRFFTLVGALRGAGLEVLLRSAGPFTLFAPVDSAFTALEPELRDGLARDFNRMRAVLEYHLLRNALAASDLRHGLAKTVEGTALRIGATDDGFTVDHANVERTQIHCRNGVIHAIDAVIMPGYRPPVVAAALEESAWSGRRRTPQKRVLV
jgi:uncharacterized surface protein with fasciclin (FAS1) repeats